MHGKFYINVLCSLVVYLCFIKVFEFYNSPLEFLFSYVCFSLGIYMLYNLILITYTAFKLPYKIPDLMQLLRINAKLDKEILITFAKVSLEERKMELL